MRFKTMTLRSSAMLLASVGTMALLLVCAEAFGLMRLGEAKADQVLLGVKLTRAMGSADMMHDALRADVLAAQVAGAQASEDDKKAIRAELETHAKRFEEEVAAFEAAVTSSQMHAAISSTKPKIAAYIAQAKQLADGALNGSLDETQKQSFVTAFKQLGESLEALNRHVETEAETAVSEQAKMFAMSRWLIGLTVLAATGALTAYGIVFVRTTLRRLGAEPNDLRDFAERIASGVLSGGLDVNPAPHSVADSMLKMERMLTATVHEIRQGAEMVATASQQIAQADRDLSERTEKQAAAIEQTASSMEQLGATVQHNTHSALQANELAVSACAVASKGGHIVGEFVHTMKGINDSSKKIVDIIGVIDSIAFQTNILALNAAVEAARAGEQGRGFAVVAGEVRSLAKRSADAAREIKNLISQSVERVDAGTLLVDQVGATMDDVVGSIKQVTDLMGGISIASREQSAGVSQAATAVAEMESTTQQNAALVEETSAAAESLQQQAQRLVASVAVFKV